MTGKRKLLEACKCVLSKNLALVQGDRVLIVTDKEKRLIGELFQDAATDLTRRVDLLEIPLLSCNGEEPPTPVAEEMLKADVILIPLSKSISWTKARLQASEEGARIASMPGITEEIMLRTFPADYETIRKRVNRLCDLFDETDEVRVVTDLGTDVSMEVDGRKGRGRSGGIYGESKAWGNLPCGEAFIAPVEGSCSGTYIVDAAHAGVGQLKAPITIGVKQGRAVEIKGGWEAGMLDGLLKSIGEADAYNIAELGIGCNDRAIADSITLEAEKASGTCHIALGSNWMFGGTVKVGIHLDGVMKDPTIFFGSQKILDEGRLVIEV